MFAILTGAAGCARSGVIGVESPAPRQITSGSGRPVPYPVTYPRNYETAIQLGTRTTTGEPGPKYWQQWSDYRLTARLHPEEKLLEGSAWMLYQNNSPDTLMFVILHLYQNLHAEGAPRRVPQEVTGGVQLTRIAVDDQQLRTGLDKGPRYMIQGTRLWIVPPEPVVPGGSLPISIDWSFKIPQAGADGRMGWDSDNLFFLAYWYPQVAVYDDVVGWQTDWFLGRAEFYAGFGSYDLTVEAPEGWVVMGTGRLQNPSEVLADHVVERLQRAEGSDGIVHVITEDDYGLGATRRSDDGYLSWNFRADSVRDVAFSVTRESLWDAARTPVGDRDGDGVTDYAWVDAIYRGLAPRWKSVARYAQHSIAFHSRFTGYSYPWPHMTVVEASKIIDGGMEFPMLTLIGDYNTRGDSALYYVTAHELAHMWLPMIVSNDERRFSWMDEGTTSFNENQARMDFFPGRNHHAQDQERYLQLARSEGEGEMMRRSDYHYSGLAFSIASYAKPASLLVALRGLLGEEAFERAYHTFINRWAFKHPYPWDLFNTFESLSGRDLEWFWRSWYYETWTLDQAVASVTADIDGTRIVIEDRGLVPMPARLTITFDNGEVVRREIPVETWLSGATRATLTLPPGESVRRVEIDAEFHFPDINHGNNVWTK